MTALCQPLPEGTLEKHKHISKTYQETSRTRQRALMCLMDDLFLHRPVQRRPCFAGFSSLIKDYNARQTKRVVASARVTAPRRSTWTPLPTSVSFPRKFCTKQRTNKLMATRQVRFDGAQLPAVQNRKSAPCLQAMPFIRSHPSHGCRTRHVALVC